MFLHALPVQALEMDFPEAWSLLQEKNHSLEAQRENVERYRQLEKSKDALNYPSVSIGANYTLLNDDATLSANDLLNSLDNTSKEAMQGLVNSLVSYDSAFAGIISGLSELNPTSTVANQNMFNSSIRAIWPVFTGGRIRAAQHAAEAQTDEAKFRLEMEEQARFEDLGKFYFSVVLAREVLETRKSVEKGLMQHKAFAIKLEEQGQIAKVERLQAEASLSKAIVDRKKAEKDLSIASTALTLILNQQDTIVPKSALFTNPNLPPLDFFTSQTLETYPGLKILDAKEKQARSLLKAEQGSYYPEVFLYGGYNLYEDESLTSELIPDWLLGVGLSFDLIDTKGRSKQVMAARHSISQVFHVRSQAVQDLTLLVEKTYYEAEQAIEEVEGLDASIELARENLNLRRKSFSQGLSTSLDVVDAELYLAGVETQQQVAKFNYLIALNRLLAVSDNMKTFSQYESTSVQHANFEESL